MFVYTIQDIIGISLLVGLMGLMIGCYGLIGLITAYQWVIKKIRGDKK